MASKAVGRGAASLMAIFERPADLPEMAQPVASAAAPALEGVAASVGAPAPLATHGSAKADFSPPATPAHRPPPLHMRHDTWGGGGHETMHAAALLEQAKRMGMQVLSTPNTAAQAVLAQLQLQTPKTLEMSIQRAGEQQADLVMGAAVRARALIAEGGDAARATAERTLKNAQESQDLAAAARAIAARKVSAADPAPQSVLVTLAEHDSEDSRGSEKNSRHASLGQLSLMPVGKPMLAPLAVRPALPDGETTHRSGASRGGQSVFTFSPLSRPRAPTSDSDPSIMGRNSQGSDKDRGSEEGAPIAPVATAVSAAVTVSVAPAPAQLSAHPQINAWLDATKGETDEDVRRWTQAIAFNSDCRTLFPEIDWPSVGDVHAKRAAAESQLARLPVTLEHLEHAMLSSLSGELVDALKARLVPSEAWCQAVLFRKDCTRILPAHDWWHFEGDVFTKKTRAINQLAGLEITDEDLVKADRMAVSSELVGLMAEKLGRPLSPQASAPASCTCVIL
jgi:hypothetical protein